MPERPHLTRSALVTWLVLAVSLVVVIANSLDYFELEEEIYAAQIDTYQDGTRRAAAAIGQRILLAEQAAAELAQAIGEGRLAPAEYEQALAAMVAGNDMFYGGAIAFAPYAFDPGRRLYAPYVSKRDGELEFTYIEQAYDYTADQHEWYVQAMASGSRWSQPYFDESVGDILMTTYSAVITRSGDEDQAEPVGVVTVDLAMESIGEVVRRFDLGGAGYVEILSDQGIYLYSPDRARVLDRASLADDPRWTGADGFASLAQLLESGQPGLVRLRDLQANTTHWISLAAPLTGSGWRVMGVFTQREVDPKTAGLRHRLMFIILGLVTGLCTVLLHWQVVKPRDAVLSWPTVLLVSLVLVMGVIQIWRVAMVYDSAHDRERYAISSDQAMAREVETYVRRARERLMEAPEFVPTGLYVESMRFLANSDLAVVGSIWQKLEADGGKQVQPGFVFPGAARVRLNEPFELVQGDTRLVRWQFSGEWRFRHLYSRYPLVRDVFSIGVLPLDTADNVMLLPDLASYTYLAPDRLPGVGPDVFLLGWQLDGSYFELRPWRHATTFGRADTLSTDQLPELFYSIEVKKAFIHSVISSLTPLVIALLITFITLLISTSDRSRLEFLRTGVGFEIGISTSIFFVVVLSHIGLRERIVSEEVFYLEYFYMLMYANLIWKCSHSILSGLDSPLLGKLTFGVSAKKAFFPVNCLLIFCFTWLAFYA